MRMIAIVMDLTPAPLSIPKQIIYFDAQDFPEARDKLHKMLKDKWVDRTFTVDISLLSYPGIQISV